MIAISTFPYHTGPLQPHVAKAALVNNPLGKWTHSIVTRFGKILSIFGKFLRVCSMIGIILKLLF